MQRLADKKVLLSLSGRLLGLAIPGPMKPMAAVSITAATAALNPTYGKLTADRALDEMRPSIALSCIRLPQDQPLHRWLVSSTDLVAAKAGTPKPPLAIVERKAVSASRAEVEVFAPIPAPPRIIPLQVVHS